MDEPSWGLDPAQLGLAFPFHLVLDRELLIVQAGASVRRLHDHDIVGRSFRELFEVATPEISCTFDALQARPRSLFLLQSSTRPGLVLRGQMFHDPVAECLIFIGSPWVTQTSAFASLGLTLDDFAVSDAVVDYVLLLQNQSRSLTEARELAGRLNDSACLLYTSDAADE